MIASWLFSAGSEAGVSIVVPYRGDSDLGVKNPEKKVVGENTQVASPSAAWIKMVPPRVS